MASGLDAYVDKLRGLSGSHVTEDTALSDVPAFQRTLLVQAISKLAGGRPVTVQTVTDAYEWTSKSYNGAVTNGTEATLRPVSPSDIPLLYEASLDPGRAYRWRFRGATPSLQQFQQLMYQGTLAQFVVTAVPGGPCHGLVALYNAMHEAGWAYIAYQRVAKDGGGTVMSLGMLKLIAYAFEHWPFRKLYAELPQYNADHLLGSTTGIGLPIREEGRLHDHIYHDGRYFDQITVAIYRDSFEQWSAQWRPLLGLTKGISDEQGN